MDFHALPRRDLQALCKRNGVRANITNAAMADALRALPTVDGIEQYVKQPIAVPEPAGKAAVAEEAWREKQGSPLPRSRRVTAKASEVVEPDEGEGDEQKNADAKREEDAPALGVGRRGASRRARPAPVVAASTAELATKAAAPEEKQGSSFTRARRVTSKPSEPTRPNDVVKEKEDIQQQANNDDAPVQVVGRRAPSRRARPSPVVAASTVAPEIKAAAPEEKQGSPLPRARRVTSKPTQRVRPIDVVEEKEDIKQQASNVDAPVQVVGRRCPSRRARPSPVVSKPATEEELGSPVGQGCSVTTNVKSSTPISTEGGEEDKKEDMHREASKRIAPALGVGRRARTGVVVSAPADTVPAEEDAPIPRGRRGKGKAPEPIKLNSSEEEDKEECAQPVRRGPTRRAQRAPLEPPATTRRDTANSTEAPDMLVETVPVRPTRVRKPTAKAAAATQRVPRRTTKKGAATNSTLPKGKQQEGPQAEAVSPLTSNEACYDLDNGEEAAHSQNLEQSEVLNESEQEDEEVVMNEDDTLMHETPAEKPSVTDEILIQDILTEETHANNGECMGNSAVEKEECKEKSPVQERQLDVEPFGSLLHGLEDSPVLGLVSMLPEQTAEKNKYEAARFQEGARPSKEQLYKGMVEEKGDATDDEAEEGPNTVDEAVIVECLGNIISAVEEKSAVETVVSEPVQNEGVISDTVAQFTVIEGKNVDKMVEQATEELPLGSAKLDEDDEEDQSDFVCVDEQKLDSDVKAELVADKLPQSIAKIVDDVEEDDFQSGFVHVDEEKLVVDVEKAQLVTDKLAQCTATLDEDVEKDSQTGYSVQDVFMLGDIVDEKVLIIKEIQQGTATKDEEDDGHQLLQSDYVLDDKQTEVGTDDKGPKLTVNYGEVDGERNDDEIIQEARQSIGTMDECVQEGYSGMDFVQADEPGKVFAADNVVEVSQTEDYGDHITSALLDDISEPTVYINDDVTMCKSSSEKKPPEPVCKNSSEKKTSEPMCKNISENIDEPVCKNIPEPVCRNSSEKNISELMCKNISENIDEPVCKNESENITDEPVGEIKIENKTAEPVTMQENMGVKVAKKSSDLNHRSLRKLRAMLKEKLELNKSKRVALARVDENVSRSN